MWARIKFLAKKFAINPDKTVAKKGFKISSSNFNFISIVFVITFKSNKHATIKLTNQPKINATIPLHGIKKYMKKRFIPDAIKLFLKTNICLSRPFKIPDKTICK